MVEKVWPEARTLDEFLADQKQMARLLERPTVITIGGDGTTATVARELLVKNSQALIVPLGTGSRCIIPEAMGWLDRNRYVNPRKYLETAREEVSKGLIEREITPGSVSGDKDLNPILWSFGYGLGVWALYHIDQNRDNGVKDKRVREVKTAWELFGMSKRLERFEVNVEGKTVSKTAIEAAVIKKEFPNYGGYRLPKAVDSLLLLSLEKDESWARLALNIFTTNFFPSMKPVDRSEVIELLPGQTVEIAGRGTMCHLDSVISKDCGNRFEIKTQDASWGLNYLMGQKKNGRPGATIRGNGSPQS